MPSGKCNAKSMEFDTSSVGLIPSKRRLKKPLTGVQSIWSFLLRVDSILSLGISELTRAEWKQIFTKLTFRDKDDIEIMAFDYVDGTETIRLPVTLSFGMSGPALQYNV